MKWINTVFNKKVDAIGLSIFRILYSIVLFFEIKQLYTFRHLIYDKDPYRIIGELDVAFIFKFWFVIVLFLCVGIFKRLTTIINYIFSVVIFSSAITFEYHVFYAYVGINFLLMFMPINRVLSIDALIEKLKYSVMSRQYKIDRKILKINYLIVVFAALGLVYFDSIFHKLSSVMWTKGLGVWLPSSLPMVTWTDSTWLLNQKWLMLFLGYLVLVFETVFIALFWFKRYRIVLLSIGLFLHIGILITYPIPWFALTAIVVYVLMVPISFWLKISNSLKLKSPLYKFYYDLECPLCNKIIIIIKHFDVFNAIQCVDVQNNFTKEEAFKNIPEEDVLINIHGVDKNGKVYIGYYAYVKLLKAMIYTYPLGLILSLPLINVLGRKLYQLIAGKRITERCTVDNCNVPVFTNPISENEELYISGLTTLKITKLFWKVVIVIMFFGQVLMIWFSPLFQQHYNVSIIDKVLSYPYKKLNDEYKDYLGLTHHPVFMYKNHFEDYKYVFKVVSINSKNEETIIPLLNNDAMVVKSVARGAFWVNSTFRVNGPHFNLNKYEKGLLPYLRYYETLEEDIKGYKIYYKTINPVNQWSKDFLINNINSPWKSCGFIKPLKNEYQFNWDKAFEEKLD